LYTLIAFHWPDDLFRIPPPGLQNEIMYFVFWRWLCAAFHLKSHLLVFVFFRFFFCGWYVFSVCSAKRGAWLENNLHNKVLRLPETNKRNTATTIITPPKTT